MCRLFLYMNCCYIYQSNYPHSACGVRRLRWESSSKWNQIFAKQLFIRIASRLNCVCDSVVEFAFKRYILCYNLGDFIVLPFWYTLCGKFAHLISYSGSVDLRSVNIRPKTTTKQSTFIYANIISFSFFQMAKRNKRERKKNHWKNFVFEYNYITS